MLGTNQYFKGEKGLELTNVEWLLDHHETKLQERRNTVDELNLKPGRCSTGFRMWTRFMDTPTSREGEAQWASCWA